MGTSRQPSQTAVWCIDLGTTFVSTATTPKPSRHYKTLPAARSVKLPACGVFARVGVPVGGVAEVFGVEFVLAMRENWCSKTDAVDRDPCTKYTWFEYSRTAARGSHNRATVLGVLSEVGRKLFSFMVPYLEFRALLYESCTPLP